ncbi:hypothetical protein EDB84DRAFT_1438725 [Lactarius hengduanensis]|nr:hypothetical protein EDB84DRAFT_1438725 [Lactarius hengduanensis]
MLIWVTSGQEFSLWHGEVCHWAHNLFTTCSNSFPCFCHLPLLFYFIANTSQAHTDHTTVAKIGPQDMWPPHHHHCLKDHPATTQINPLPLCDPTRPPLLKTRTTETTTLVATHLVPPNCYHPTDVATSTQWWHHRLNATCLDMATTTSTLQTQHLNTAVPITALPQLPQHDAPTATPTTTSIATKPDASNYHPTRPSAPSHRLPNTHASKATTTATQQHPTQPLPTIATSHQL